MKYGSIAYVPPPSFPGASAFLKNITHYKPVHPMILISDHPYDESITKIRSPEFMRNAVRNEQQNKWALSNALFLTSMKIARGAGLTHVIYLESDCRVGVDGWDKVMTDEFESITHHSKLIAAGSVMFHNPCNHNDAKFRTRWAEITGKSASGRHGFPAMSYALGGPQSGGKPAITINGALGIYNIEKVFDLLPIEKSRLTELASSLSAWDFELGFHAYDRFGSDATDLFGMLNCILSSYADVQTTERERADLLMNRKFVAVHQIKSDWSGTVTGTGSRIKAPPAQKRAILQLGRYGDIINILPVAQRWAHLHGEPVPMIVSKQFADVLDGVDYVRPVPVDVAYHRTREARHAASDQVQGFEVVNTQVYRTDDDRPGRQTSAFNLESWRLAGELDRFYSARLEFNRRDHNRELEFIRKTGIESKDVVMLLHGHSSVLPDGDELRRLIKTCMDNNGINWNEPHQGSPAKRIYDLLGVFDVCRSAILSDSAPLHLAAACPHLRFTAFISDTPDQWHGTQFRERNQATTQTFRYKDIDTDKIRLEWAPPDICHCYSWHKMNEDLLRRHTVARRTWNALYRHPVKPLPILDSYTHRDASDVGDMALPYVKDMFDWACLNSGSDRVMFSNSDICMVPEIYTDIMSALNNHGCYFGKRVDVQDARFMPNLSIRNPFVGADVFAFTKKWWADNRDDFPDLILAREGWDAVLKLMMIRSGFREMDTRCWHEIHENVYTPSKMTRLPGQRHNRQLTHKWFMDKGESRFLNCHPTDSKPLVKGF